MELKVGDVVRLKSGGPEMTVEEISENKYITCVWFERNMVRTHAFRTELLER